MPPESSLTSGSDLEIEASLETKLVDAKYVCHICKESFKRLDHLDRHVFKHTGIKKHICSHINCNKSYSILTHLKRHVRNTHERVGPVQKNVRCGVAGCEKLFQSNCSMQKHVREVHENPKLYYCSFCNEKFRQKLKMRRHEISKHTLEYPYNCTKCSKGFYQQWQHDKHLPTCKIYSCSNCQLVFNKWSLYQKHCRENQHGRQYYKCDECARIYAKPSDLRKHITARHTEDALKIIYKCTYDNCERVYDYQRNLTQHIRIAHKVLCFTCEQPDCKQSFSSAQNLRKHMQRVHDSSKIAEPTLNNKTKKQSKRKKRKDAGKSIVSQLSKMSGLAVDKDFDALLRQRKKDALEVAGRCLTPDVMEAATENVANATSKIKDKEVDAEVEVLFEMALQEYT